MHKLPLAIIGILLSVLSFVQLNVISKKTNNPNLKWWQNARFGMFIYWGPVSLVGKEISWSRGGYGILKYDSLYLRFNPVKFNAREWVAAAKYIPSTEKDSIATTICLIFKSPTGIANLIAPFSTTNSFGYKKKATASGFIALFLHNPDAAFDEGPDTYWKLGRKKEVAFSSYFGKVLNYQIEKTKNV